jgi:large subunit ribosomal protein L5
MATTETYTPRLKKQYNDELRPELQEKLGLSSIMQVPRIAKITLNMGVGEGKNDAKQIDAAQEELTTIAGQRAQVRRARKSIAQFKIREGMPIGVKVTLRGDRMWEFLDRLVSIALPRIRDFRGLDPGSFDGRGNYSLGIREQIIFPEIDYDSINLIRGLDVTITTEGAVSGEEVACRQGRASCEVQGAQLHPLQPLRAPACRLQEVRALPYLPAGARPSGRHPRHDQELLVGGT